MPRRRRRQIREINTGIYCVESRFLFAAVAGLGNRNAQGEYYLTDIVEIACNNGLRVMLVPGARSGGGHGDQHARGTGDGRAAAWRRGLR